jgi:hypothetical protein
MRRNRGGRLEVPAAVDAANKNNSRTMISLDNLDDID